MSKDLRLRVMMTGTDNLSGPLKNIVGASKMGQQAMEGLRSEVVKLTSQQRQVRSFATLKREVGEARTAMDAAKEKASALGRELAQTAKPTKALKAEFERARRSAKTLEEAYHSKSKRLNSTRSELAAAGIATKNLAAHERDLAKRAKEATDALAKQQKQAERLQAIHAKGQGYQDKGADLRSSGASNMVTGAAMAAPMALAARDAITMESAMADVRKVVDFKSPEQFAKLSDDLVTLSMKIPMAADGLAQIVAEAGRAGVKRKDLLIFAEDAAKMGVAFDTTAEDAGAMMAKWRTAFAMGQDDVRDLSDKINALTNTYGGNVAAVSGMVTRIGALGGVSGVAADEIAAIGQVMSSVGVGEEMAATGIKNFMLAMNKGSAATKTQQRAFGSLGLDAVKVSQSMQTNAAGAIDDILQRIAKLPEAQRAATLTQLFGSESVGAIAPMLTNLDQLKKNFALIGDKAQYADSMNKEFLSAINKTEGALGLAKNAAKAINIELGNMLLPIISEGSRRFVEIAGSVRGWIKENPGLSQGLMLVYGSVTGLVLGMGALKIGMGLLMGPFGAIFKLVAANGPMLMSIFGGLKVAAIGLAGALGMPIWAVAAVAAGLAAAGYLIYKHWATIRNYITQNWTTIRNLMLGALVIFAPFIAAIVFVAKKIYDNWDAIVGSIRAGVAAVWSFISPVIQPILSIADTLTGLVGKFLQIGWDLMKGLAKGIFNGAKEVLSGVADVAGSIGASFAALLGIKSPSRLFMAFGGHITDGLARGIDGGRAAPMRAARVMAAGVAGASFATASMAAPSAGSAAPMAAAGASFGAVTITINAAPGQSAQDIAAAVQAALQAQAAKAAAASRSSYRDD